MTEESRYYSSKGHHGTYTIDDKKGEMPIIFFQNEKMATQFLNHLQNNEEKIKELKQKSDNKQEHIVLLEDKIHRMRENIKRLEVLYHYRYQEGSVDLKKECWELKQKVGTLKGELNESVEIANELRKEVKSTDVTLDLQAGLIESQKKQIDKLAEENEMLKNHIKRNTISRITIEDVLDCAINHRFTDNKEIIQAINCIAKDLGVKL